MSINEELSFTEYTLTEDTTDFIISFDRIGGSTDEVSILVNNTPIEDLVGYTVLQVNFSTWQVDPALPAGTVVRLARTTNLDKMVYVFTAGSKFIAKNVDDNFKQIQHSQQEIRDRQDKLEGDATALLLEISDVKVIAEQAAEDANEALEKVDEILNTGVVPAGMILTNSGQNQQQINDFGGAKWYAKIGGYDLGAEVRLDNGDHVRSTIDGNTNNPNIDMVGWINLDISIFPDVFAGTTNQKLQAALDTGGYVIIAKPYTIGAPLSINIENTKVWFYGSGKITTTANTNIFNMYADHCKVLNAKLEGFGSPSTALYNGTGITLHGVKGCEVSYAKISKTGGSPIALLARNASGVVKSCTDNVIAYNDIDCSLASKRTFDSAGVLIGYTNEQATGYSHDNNHIYANHVQGKTKIDHGIAMIGHGKGNRFTQNYTHDCLEYGIAVYQSPYIDNTLYDNTVSGNWIRNIGHVSDNLCIKGMGIYLQKSDSTLVHGNIIDNVLLGTNNDTNLTRAAIGVNGCVGALVSDNIIENSKQFGIQFAECYGCKATDNFIDKVTLDLIRITSSSKIDITGNTGLNGGRYGVYIENFNRTTGRADYNGTSGDGINIVGNDLNCVNEGVWSSSSNAANKMIDSRIDSNLIKTPAISIYVANAANTSITSNKCKSTTNLARIQVVESDKLTVNCNTIESTAVTDSGRIVLNSATNYVVEGNLFSPSNSTTPIYINGQPFKAAKKRLYGTGVPAAGTYEAGDIIWNTSPVLGGALGWICIVSGTVGTWVQFGEIGGGLVSLTTTTLQNATASINTVGKYAGKEVFNQTDSKKYYAEGNTPTSRWMRFDSTGSVTPV